MRAADVLGMIFLFVALMPVALTGMLARLLWLGGHSGWLWAEDRLMSFVDSVNAKLDRRQP